jgi:acyl carrier protein
MDAMENSHSKTFELVRAALLELHPHVSDMKFSPATPISDLDIDSVATLELVGKLEKDIGALLPDDELVHLQTLADVVKLIDRYAATA